MIRMKRNCAAVALLVLSTHSVTAATSAISADSLDAGLLDETRLARPAGASSVPDEPVTTVRVTPPRAPERPSLSANPLWGIPLSQLSATRERPIFSPSRRPPPPVAAAEPVVVKAPAPRRKEITPPPLSLVGTIASEDEGFGIFLDQSSKTALRLKLGDDYQGWKLRSIRGREVTMEKDEQAAVLSLPEPGGAGSGEVHLVPVSAVNVPIARQR
ncbi:hypothetical protein [Bradyrhizobium sp. ARR65]|uniref:hypothetical protein n=1 Tax=Bradyrhizobium sp. ARR65 TaxID=1040989 RepID=UPI00046710F6|nr:hypothetical protein [Bradyrhizobium sp. ARR65]